jgi:hypothetical protein
MGEKMRVGVPHVTNGLFGELYISTNVHTGVTRIGIYDQGYESFEIGDVINIKNHLNSIILKLKFPSKTDGMPF